MKKPKDEIKGIPKSSLVDVNYRDHKRSVSRPEEQPSQKLADITKRKV